MPEFDLQFTVLLVVSGLMIGLMYALIALGFVLVYKATGAINFAQGEFVMLGALIAAAVLGAALPFWLACLLSLGGMIAFCFGLERVVLRRLLGRPTVAVIMATIGLASLIDGGAILIFGPGVRSINMPVGDMPLFLGPIMLQPVQIAGAAVSLVFLAAFTWFFLKTRVGVAMRAVADNQTVSMGMGINVQRYFAMAWALTGIVLRAWGRDLGAMSAWTTNCRCRPEGIPGGDLGRARLPSLARWSAAWWSASWRRWPPAISIRSWAAVPGFRALRVHDPGAHDPTLRLCSGTTPHRTYLAPRAIRGSEACSIARPATSKPATPPTWRCCRDPARAGPPWLSRCCSCLSCRLVCGEYLIQSST